MQLSPSRVKAADLTPVLRLLRRRLRAAHTLALQSQFSAALQAQDGIDALITGLAERPDEELVGYIRDLYAQCLDLNDALQDLLEERRDDLDATLRAVRLENSIASFLRN